ncbi:MAG TPA: CAP domain-containing protein [Candidatus Angelobacter sp.]|jgi:hypothetical protein
MKLFIFLLAICALTGYSPAAAQPSSSPTEKQIFDQLNHERERAGFAALEWNISAATAARQHSRLLAEKSELSHQFQGEASLPERLASTGVRFTVSAENVARTEYVEDIHPALMGSSGHRANMLNPEYNAVGIGVAESKGKVYVTQDFIFLVPAYSESQFSTAFSEAFHLARKARGIRDLEARPDALLRELACTTEGDANKMADKISGARAVVVFTSSDPHHLPDQLQGRVANADFHRMNFGVCFRPDQKHGYANFWVVAAFAN